MKIYTLEELNPHSGFVVQVRYQGCKKGTLYILHQTLSQKNVESSVEMSIFQYTDTEIRAHIETSSVIRTKEKDRYGEVFTSIELIEELFDHLPANVWKNSDLKWLDPAAGQGNFTALAYIRLMKGLASVIKDPKRRKTHILDKMLYMVELNPSNVRTLRRLFGENSKISSANFLDQKDKWGRDLGETAFDVVIGNPPFQTSKTGTYAGSSGNRTLWNKFLDMILKQGVLKPRGHLAFITPANWRRPESPLYNMMTKENTLKYLHIYGKKDGQAMLGAQTRFDLYIVQEGASDPKQKTAIIDENGYRHELATHSWPFLPNYAFSEIRAMLVPKEKGIPVIFSAGTYDARKLSKTKTRQKPYPVVHNITRRGLGIRYATERQKEHMGVPKVLLNFNEKQYPYNDYKGEYGMSQLTFGIPIQSKKEGELWIRALTSPRFERILAATKWGSFQTDYRMFRYFDSAKIFQTISVLSI
jgi:hypothetical protein